MLGRNVACKSCPYRETSLSASGGIARLGIVACGIARKMKASFHATKIESKLSCYYKWNEIK